MSKATEYTQKGEKAMSQTGIPCPICGKYFFDDFSDFDDCSVCGWKINIRQYDDHDFSDGTNALSVNEYKIQYALLTDERTKEKALELKTAYIDKVNGMRKRFREGGRTKTGIGCTEMMDDISGARVEYVEQLRTLAETIK